MKHIPLVDEPLPRPVRWGAAELARLTAMVEQSSLFYWKGTQTAALVAEFRKHYPLEHCFPCSSGTAAIHVAIASLRLRPGEEVITSPITDMGTVVGILFQQGVPIFADLEPQTYNLDARAIEKAITPKTRAIVAVHLAGNPCDMNALVTIAKRHGLTLIEDCAQSWGAEYQGRPVGTMGDFGCYSFNDFKHISCGDGGIVGTNCSKVGTTLGKWGDKSYDRVSGEKDPALLRNPADLATNYRITEPQAAVAAAQLTKLKDIVGRRHRNGCRLLTGLSEIPGLLLPLIRAGDRHSFWFCMIRMDLSRFKVGRDEFVAALSQEGVVARAGYIPMPVYAYRVFQNHNFFGGTWLVRDAGYTTIDYRNVRCPTAEAILADAIVLPVNEAMSVEYVDKVVRGITVVAKRLGQ